MKELPDVVKCLYPDSKEYCVPGDGACCLNCLAAWIYLYATKGSSLSRDLNTHLAEYREYYLNELVFPLTVTVSGGERGVFEKGEENVFFDTLVSYPETSYLWRESVDLIGLANFTNMEIEFVVLDPATGQIEQPN